MFNGGHTINEGTRPSALLPRVVADSDRTAMKAEGFIEEIRFFVRLILNADESSLLD